MNACPGCGSLEMHTLCSGTDRLYQTTDRSFLVVECHGCRLIRLYPWPSPEEISSYYPENYWYDPGADTADQLAEVWRRLVLRDHVRFSRRALKESGLAGPVLDVGCGGGLFLREMNLPHNAAFGLDFNVNAGAVAWSTNGIPVACGTLPSAPFRARSFAMITMFHVLEHLYEPAAYLEAARNLLKPGGRLVIQVPNAACWQFLLLGANWTGVDIPRHLFDFQESDIANLLDYCGFEIVRRRYFSLRDNPAGLATSLAPGLDPMARRIRATPESPRLKLFRDALYFLLVLLAIPFTVVEAACRAGSTIMIEAKLKKP